MKNLFKISFIMLLAIWSFVALAAFETKSPTNYNNSGGDASFGTTNLAASDNNWECVNLEDGDDAKGYFTDFGFTIPAGATINSVSIVLEGVWNADNARDKFMVRLINNNGDEGDKFIDDKTYFSSIESTGTLIDSTFDIFGLDINELSVDEINGSDFGLRIEDIQSKKNSASFCFDYLAITVDYTDGVAICNPCYSIASTGFGTASTWSDVSGGGAQTTIPVDDGTIEYIIEGGFVVDVDGDYNVKNITVGATGTGELEWSGNNELTFYNATGLDVNANGTINQNGNNGAKLIFDQGAVSYALVNDGTFDIADIDVGAGNTLTLTGGANMTIDDELKVLGDAVVITNNNTATVFVNDDIHFGDKTTTFTNNGTIDVGSQLKNITAGEVTWTQGAGSILILSGTGTPIDTDMDGFDATAAGNFVKYDAAGDQQMHDPIGNDYFHLNLETNGTKETTAVLDIAGDITFSGSANLDLNADGFDLFLAGDWVSSSSNAYNGTNQTVTFDGAANQTITASNQLTEVFYNLTINNGGNTVVLNNNIEVENILDFAGAIGYIDINTKDLTMGSWANINITNNSNTAFIIVDQTGFIKFTGIDPGEVLMIPMGLTSAATDYTLASITLTDAGDGNFSANLCDQLELGGGICTGAPDIIANAVDYTWNLVSTSTNAIVKLYWDSSKELAGFDRTNSTVAHYNGTYWEELAFSAATAEGGTMFSRTATTTSFSPFAIEDDAIPLPITLSHFKAVFKNNVVELDWSTISETNNDYFIVEKSTEGLNFTEIKRIDGATNSKTLLNYKYIDTTPFDGVNYYRLKQVDFNGDNKTFKIVATNNLPNTGSKLKASIYPNPIDKGGSVKIKFNKVIQPESLLIVLVDFMGNQYIVKPNFICCDSYGLETGNLSSGIYYIVAFQKEEILATKKLVIQ